MKKIMTSILLLTVSCFAHAGNVDGCYMEITQNPINGMTYVSPFTFCISGSTEREATYAVFGRNMTVETCIKSMETKNTKSSFMFYHNGKRISYMYDISEDGKTGKLEPLKKDKYNDTFQRLPKSQVRQYVDRGRYRNECPLDL
jgi:hypothetical protein